METCEVCEDGFALTNDKKSCLSAITNCREYDISNEFSTSLTCKFCDDKLTYNSTSTKCDEGTVVNCKVYEPDQVCYECEQGFYIPDKECLEHKSITNCTSYERVEAHTCSTC